MMRQTEMIRRYIAHDLLNDPTMTFTDSQDLLTTGILDSISVMRLIAQLESEIGIAIPPEDVVLDNFGSLDRIVDYLNSKVS